MHMRTRRLTAALAAGGAAVAVAATAAASGPAVSSPPPRLLAVIDLTNHLTLTDAHGRAVANLKSGWYTLTIKDSNVDQSFELKGPGVNRTTGSHFVGAAIWGLQLQKGKYTYSSLGPKKITRSFSVG
jgi:hypothetical protein